jgi:predicted nucleic acid-binding protein
MAVTQYLVDKSVWARMHQPDVLAEMMPLIERGIVATCAIVDLEILYSARNRLEYQEMAVERQALEWLPMTDDVCARACEVQAEFAGLNKHRSIPLPDLLIAAVAERHSATVLHYDADFDAIAAVTGQSTKCIVPADTADGSAG